ncbi:MAG: DUF455 family protein [Verrucomicrobiales bacterium]|nr:DUF455 family protein [Verrucomicrobiales bacterium]
MERSRANINWNNPTNSPIPADPGCSESRESISDLARRVLFSDSIEEKLRLARRPLCEDSGDSGERSLAVAGPIVPGRPRELRFATDSSARPGLPGRPALVTDANRGVLLHFFANHELLAAELMALALLKFPDAPVEFRQGLANTLREEQLHTRWYVNRMKECGVEFGQYPVSRFFWEAVAQMQCPLDYVSRLSLTFEQANLDYSLHYGRLLEEAGDRRSASILFQIYKDEISHVGYGLQWFRRWKEEGESDWTALEKRLPFPLSPSRAKGNRTIFNEEGRRTAGFDEDYIRNLALFERSKGRTPDVFYFNPEAEHRAAVWPRPYHPDKTALSVIRDLEILAGFLAKKDDVLLMRRPPSQGHLANLRNCGLALPEIESLDPNGRLVSGNLILERKVNSIQPWGLSPDLSTICRQLQQSQAIGKARLTWDASRRSLYSKVEQVRQLTRWMEPSFVCDSEATVIAAVSALKELGWKEGLWKRAFSTAGSGMLPTLLDETTLTNRPLSEKILAEGGILLEPLHDRIFDFSIQYEIIDGQIRLIGFVEQVISPRGGYRGSLSRIKFCAGLEPNLARYLAEEVLPIYHEDGSLARDLIEFAKTGGYEGPMGVDAYLYRSREGHPVLRPICEVNPRYTMGRLAHELRRQVAPGHGVRFQILKPAELPFPAPVPLLDTRGRICGGSVILTETHEGTRFAAMLSVAKSFPRSIPE